MKRIALLTILAGTVGVSVPLLHGTSPTSPTASPIGQSASDRAASPGSVHHLKQLPILFEPNQGQVTAPFAYVARAPGYSIGIDALGVEIRMPEKAPTRVPSQKNVGDKQAPAVVNEPRRVAFRLQPIGISADARLLAEGKQVSVSHYLDGGENRGTVKNVPHYAQIRFQQIYDGIDWVFYGNPEQTEYDFIVAPHARPEQIRLAITGAEDLALTADGELVTHIGNGEFRHQKPAAFQRTPSGERRQVEVAYTLSQPDKAKPSEIAFAIGDYDRSRPLTIDPVLTYSTYLGGTGNDTMTSFTVAADESVYIAGTMQSVDFPRQTADRAPPQAYVAKFNASGSALEYVAFLGNTSGPAAVRAASNGDVFVAGVGRIPGNTTNSACTDGYAATLINSGVDLVNERCLPPLIASTANGERSATSVPSKIRINASGIIYRPQVIEYALPDEFFDVPRRAGRFDHSVVMIDSANSVISSIFIGSTSYGYRNRGIGTIQSLSVTDEGAMVALFDNCRFSDGDTSGRASAVMASPLGEPERRFDFSSGDCFVDRGNATAIGADGRRYFSFTLERDVVPIDDPDFDFGDEDFVVRIFDEFGRKLGSDVGAIQPAFAIRDFTINSRGSVIVSEGLSGAIAQGRIRKLDPDRSKAGSPHEFVVHEQILADTVPSILSFGRDSLLVVETTASDTLRGEPQPRVAGGTDAAISRYELSGCIENNGLLSLDQANLSIAESGTEITVGVTRSMVTDSQCSAHVRYQTNASTAAAGQDFANTSGMLRWAPGENGTKVIRIPIANDSLYELTEALTISLSEPVGSTLDANSSATVSITDDDPMPSVGLRISASSIPEVGGTATLTAGLSAVAGTAVIVPLVFSGDATQGADYHAPSVIVIPAGARAVDTAVQSVDNTLPEPDETATIAIGRPTSAVLGSRTTATFTVVDNDRVPGVSTAPSSLAFGNQAVGSTSAARTLTLTNSGTDPLTISFIGASGDFTASPNCPTVLAASASCSIAVQFRPSLQGPRSGAVSILSNAPTSPNSVQLTGTGTGTRPSLSISDVSIAEGNAGTKAASLTVSLSAAAREPVSVKLRSRNGTATAGSDYVAVSSTLTIPAGRTTATVSVTINGDASFEADEVLYVDLSEPVNAAIADGEGVITIVNDDAAPGTPGISVPTRSFNFGNVRVGSSSVQRSLTITSSGTAPLAIRSIRVTGDFVGTSNCPASLAPGATCALTGTFKPATTGPRTGTVTITSNAPDSPTVVQLSGTGT
ncbi:MAG: choice-of-anchor D domain-containing protein [Gammaproteobacteria bacterium]|nr:choice-of-anchor D domain-containing protein [Gammaproteobacteria bacterium]